MRKTSLLGVILLLSFAAAAYAQPVRTFVATNGVDTNPCSRVAPCRNFGAAMAATAAAGEVVALDSGGYGAVTIDRGITIIAPEGVHAAIAPTSGAAISVNALATDKIVIRNLYLNSQGATYGVEAVAMASLHVENVIINGFTKGISVFPTIAAELYVVDSAVRNGSDNGIEVGNSQATLDVSILRSRVQNQGLNGVIAFAGADVVAVDTVVSGGAVGFRSTGATSRLLLERCTASGNTSGLYADTATNFEVSNSTIVFNFIGINRPGISSRGNNTLRMNDTNGTFTATFAQQ